MAPELNATVPYFYSAAKVTYIRNCLQVLVVCYENDFVSG